MLRSFHKIRRCHLLRNFGVQHLLNEQHNNKQLLVNENNYCGQSTNNELSESGCSYKEINLNTSSSSSQGDKRSYNYKNKNYYKKFNLNVDHWFHNCQLNFLEAVGLGTAIIAGLRLSCEVDELKRKCYKKKDVPCTNFCPISRLKNVTSLFLNNWNDIYPRSFDIYYLLLRKIVVFSYNLKFHVLPPCHHQQQQLHHHQQHHQQQHQHQQLHHHQQQPSSIFFDYNSNNNNNNNNNNLNGIPKTPNNFSIGTDFTISNNSAINDSQHEKFLPSTSPSSPPSSSSPYFHFQNTLHFDSNKQLVFNTSTNYGAHSEIFKSTVVADDDDDELVRKSCQSFQHFSPSSSSSSSSFSSSSEDVTSSFTHSIALTHQSSSSSSSPLGNLYNQLFNDSCNIIASNLARRGFYKKATMIWTEVLARDPLHLKALYNLAVCHERGLGLQCHLQKAIELYRVAAEHGHIASCHKLAQLYKTINQPVANDEDDNDEAKLHKKEKYLYYPTKASKPGSLEASRVMNILKFKSDNLIGALQSAAINNNECVERNHCLKLCKELADDADDSDGAFKCDEEMSAIKLTSNSQIVTKSKHSSLSSPQSSPSFDCPYSSHLVKSPPTSLSFLPPLSIKFNLSNGSNGYMVKDEQNY